jgi:6-phosphogluconolactonase
MHIQKKIKIFLTPEQVAEEFARALHQWIHYNPQPVYHIALSGGKTPKLLFRHLTRAYKNQFPWQSIHFWWGDERCVPLQNPESNYTMTQENLLQYIAIPKENIHRMKGEEAPEAEALRYSSEIASHVKIQAGWPVFDLILLGMGQDGHTASIFAHEMHLLHSKEYCAITSHPQSGQQRITLTGRVLNMARQICFLVTGREKAQCIYQVVGDWTEREKLPVDFIQPVHGKMEWYLDEAAAHFLAMHKKWTNS